MNQVNAKVIKNIEVMPDYYKMVLDAPSIAKAAKPGQFVNILVSEKQEPFLRRPFSIHKVSNSRLEILYKVIGKGTELLSQKKPAQHLNVFGPLGNGFALNAAKIKDKIILIGGGIGVAPLIFLAEKLVEVKSKKEIGKTIVFIGAKNKRHILCADELKKIGCEVKIATEDGSLGFKGLVTALLKQNIKAKNKPTMIFSCGPKPMLKEIADIAKRYKIPAQVSLEEHMACGIGACFGCVVKTKHGYKRVCKEGPVFDIKEIVF